MLKKEERKSSIWVEMDCGLDVLIVPNGLLVRLSSVRHESMEYIPGNIDELVQWLENNKNHRLLWEMLEDETFVMRLPEGMLIKSESRQSESLKYIPITPKAARTWISSIISSKEK